jgi:hypothetical protein
MGSKQKVQDSTYTPSAPGPVRGSKKLMDAWKARALTEEAVQEIAAELENSPAVVDEVLVAGGTDASGIRLSLSYEWDDVPWCGNDIRFWLQWLRRHGGAVRPPRIIINGIPHPDLVRVQLDFGNVPDGVPGLGDVQRGVNGRFGV